MVQPEARTPFKTRLKRLGAAEILARTKLHMEVTDNPESRKKIHKLSQENYGFIEIVNHWGMMEFAAVFAFNFKNRDLRQTNMLAAFTAYQFDEKLERLGENHFSVALDRTMTPDAEEYYTKHPEQRPENADRLNALFVKDSATVLSPGGVVTISPQGQRESEFPAKYRKPMLGTFLLGLQQEGLDFNKLAFIFLATGLKGVTDYSVWKDTKYDEIHPPIQVTLGQVLTFQETPLPGNIMSRADKWARAQQAEIISPAFLPKSSAIPSF